LRQVLRAVVGFRPAHAQVVIDRLPVAPAEVVEPFLADAGRGVAGPLDHAPDRLREVPLRSAETGVSRVHSIFFGSLVCRRRTGEKPECEAIIAHLRRWVMRQLGILSLVLALSTVGHGRVTALLTEFYVDPDFNGSIQNGKAATPWSALGGGSGAA